MTCSIPSRDKCYFCNGTLLHNHEDIAWIGSVCKDFGCYTQHEYIAGSAWSGAFIRFKIGDYLFVYRFKTADFSDAMEISVKGDMSIPRYSIPYHIEVTLDNYQQVVDRIKNLQTFK